MKAIIQELLCAAGMHQHVFVGKDREDQIYRCQCGHRKVEIYGSMPFRVELDFIFDDGAGTLTPDPSRAPT